MDTINQRIDAENRSKSRRAALLLVLFAAGPFASVAVAQQATRRPSKQVVEGVDIAPQLGARVPGDLTFVDSFGDSVRLGDYFNDRPIVLHLVYYQCPMLCKLSGDGLLRSLSTLSLKPGKDFSIVTVSFDPREGPDLSAKAREMAIERVGRDAVEGGWTFLTGDQAATAALCDAVGFQYRFDEKTQQYAHGAGVFILTPEGTLSRYLAGIEYSPRDLRLAVVEASQGKVGTAVDQVMLLCYMYDPTSGRYGLAVITAVRVAGIATVATMACAIGVMLRRDRQRTQILDSAARPVNE